MIGQDKENEIQDCINIAYQNIANAKEQSDGMTAVCCLLGSIAHSLIAIAESMKEKRETGHWIDSAGDDKCSKCGATYSDLYPDYHKTHFCPNCGAKMI